MQASSISEFLVLGELGRGSYGVVCKVKHMKTQEVFVAKKIGIQHLTYRKQDEALREVQILKGLNHPHVIKYYASFIDNGYLYIIMEYAAKGDLQKLINSYKESYRKVPEADIWKWAKHIVQALKYLHSKNIIHRDIKCMNILLTSDGTAKLGDLGASKVMDNKMQVTRIGTPLYLAPEQVKQMPYDFRIDIWGLGCVLYTLACQTSPFKGENLISLGINIVSVKPKPLPTVYSKKLSDFIFGCLEKRTNKRLTLNNLEQFYEVEEETTVEDTLPALRTRIQRENEENLKLQSLSPPIKVTQPPQPVQFPKKFYKGLPTHFSKDDCPKEDFAKEDFPKQDLPKQDFPKEYFPKKDLSKEPPKDFLNEIQKDFSKEYPRNFFNEVPREASIKRKMSARPLNTDSSQSQIQQPPVKMLQRPQTTAGRPRPPVGAAVPFLRPETAPRNPLYRPRMLTSYHKTSNLAQIQLLSAKNSRPGRVSVADLHEI